MATGIVNNPNAGRLNRVVQTIDFSTSPWQNTGIHKLFDVSGLVYCRLTACVVTGLTSSSTTSCNLGIFGASTFLIPSTPKSDLQTGYIWNDAAAGTTCEYYSTSSAGNPMEFFTSNYIVVQVSTTALSTGIINFILDWFPITTGATVSAGDGS